MALYIKDGIIGSSPISYIGLGETKHNTRAGKRVREIWSKNEICRMHYIPCSPNWLAGLYALCALFSERGKYEYNQ